MKLNATINVLFISFMVLMVIVQDVQCHLHHQHQLNEQLKTLFHKMFHNQQQLTMMPAIKTKRNWIMPQLPLPVSSNSLLSPFEQPPFSVLPVFVQSQPDPQPLLVVRNMQSNLVPPSQLYGKPVALYNIPYYKYPKPNIPFNDYLPPSVVKMNEIESRTTTAAAATISKQEKPELDKTMLSITTGQPVIEQKMNEMGTNLEPDMSMNDEQMNTKQEIIEPVIMIEDLKTTTMVPVEGNPEVEKTEFVSTTSVSATEVVNVEEQEQEQNSVTTVKVMEEQEPIATTPNGLENVEESTGTTQKVEDIEKEPELVATTSKVEEEREPIATTPNGLENVEESTGTAAKVENIETVPELVATTSKVEEEREQAVTIPNELENVEESTGTTAKVESIEKEPELVATTSKVEEEREQAVSTPKAIENVEESTSTIAPIQIDQQTTLINSIVTEQEKVDGSQITTEPASQEVNEIMTITTVANIEIEQEKKQTTESSLIESTTTPSSVVENGEKSRIDSSVETDNEPITTDDQEQFNGYYYPKPLKTFIS